MLKRGRMVAGLAALLWLSPLPACSGTSGGSSDAATDTMGGDAAVDGTVDGTAPPDAGDVPLPDGGDAAPADAGEVSIPDVPGHDVPVGHDTPVGHDIPPDVFAPEVIPAGECHGVPEDDWLPPRKFTQNTLVVMETSYLVPNVAVSNDGRMHVIYVFGLGSEDKGGLFYQAEADGGYTAPYKIGPHSAIQFDLLVSPIDGSVHAFYSNLFGNKVEPLHLFLAPGGAWTQPVVIPPDPALNEIPNAPKFCFDGLGVLHMVYSLQGLQPLGHAQWTAAGGWTTSAPEPVTFPVPVIGGVSLACGLDGTLAVMAPVQGKGMAAVRAPGGAWSTPGDAIILENFGDTYNMNWDVALKPGTTNAIGLAVWYDKSKMFGWDGAAVQQLDVTGKFEFMAQIHDNMAGGGLVAVHFGKNAPGDDPLYWTRYSGAFLGPELITANASVHSTRFNAATSPDGKTTHVVWVQRDTPTEPLGTVSNMCDIRTK